MAVNIEGHTDSIPIRGRYQDNWDLSTARADAIVRILVNTYRVDPTRVVASGHSYFDPVESNSTPEGRSKAITWFRLERSTLFSFRLPRSSGWPSLPQHRPLW